MQTGRVIGGKYRLVHVLGAGAMGSVWAATHEVLGREVAIKFLLPTVESPETATARFLAEAKAAARVKHRFVVDVFDFGTTEDGLPYMVQELLHGASLAECMSEAPAWPLPDVLRLTAQCLIGLEAVHRRGIIHRDLKPENVFVMSDAEGTYPKLLDFGISKWTDGGARTSARPTLHPGRPRRLTAVGTTVGTPAYMSPEQLCNTSTMDGRSDLFSMGVILYEWLTGRLPFGDASSLAELYRRIAARSFTPLATLRPDIGPDLCELVHRALAADPEQRFESATAMRDEVLRLVPSQPLVLSTVQHPGFALAEPTAAVLKRAESPFGGDGDDDVVAVPGLRAGTLRSVVIGAAALACIGLLTLTFWPSSQASPARARGTSARMPTAAAPVAPQAVPTPPAIEPSAAPIPTAPEHALIADAAPPAAAVPEAPLDAALPESSDAAASAPIDAAVPEPEIRRGVVPDEDLPSEPPVAAAPEPAPSPRRTRPARTAQRERAAPPSATAPNTPPAASPEPTSPADPPKNSKVVRTLDF